MKAISLWQPWATLVSIGVKRFETRHWKTGYRGSLAIQAAKTENKALRGLCEREPFRSVLVGAGYEGWGDLPLGKVVAVVDFTAVYRTEDIRDSLGANELAFGDYGNGRFAWEFARVQRLVEPVSVVGRQGFFWWDVPPVAMGQLGLFVERTYVQRRDDEN